MVHQVVSIRRRPGDQAPGQVDSSSSSLQNNRLQSDIQQLRFLHQLCVKQQLYNIKVHLFEKKLQFCDFYDRKWKFDVKKLWFYDQNKCGFRR